MYLREVSTIRYEWFEFVPVPAWSITKSVLIGDRNWLLIGRILAMAINR